MHDGYWAILSRRGGGRGEKEKKKKSNLGRRSSLRFADDISLHFWFRPAQLDWGIPLGVFTRAVRETGNRQAGIALTKH